MFEQQLQFSSNHNYHYYHNTKTRRRSIRNREDRRMIQLQDISKSYPMGKRKLEVLRGINLKVDKGEMTAKEYKSWIGNLPSLPMPNIHMLRFSANKLSSIWAANLRTEAAKKMAQQNPMLSSLEGIHSVLFSFDYRDKAIEAEIKALNKDEQKNKQIADFLTGLKALGGMAGSSKPEVGELMNKIIVSSGPDSVSVSANIPEDLINKLGEEAKKAMPQMEREKKETEEPKTQK
jgi:hypothetical protein